jgi:hypothetical protein
MGSFKTVIKIGLLNNNTAISRAVRLALTEINALGIIPGAIVTLIEKDSSTDMTQAVFSTVSLIQDGVIGVIGDISFAALTAFMTSTLQIPQCSFSANARELFFFLLFLYIHSFIASFADKSDYHYFFRTIPTDLLYDHVIQSFLVHQNLSHLGILHTGDNQQCKCLIFILSFY